MFKVRKVVTPLHRSGNEEKAGSFQAPPPAAMKVSIQKMAGLDFLQYWISKCLSCETNYSTTSCKFAPTGSHHQNAHLSSQLQREYSRYLDFK